MSTEVIKISKDMLGGDGIPANTETPSFVQHDLGNLASFVDIEVPIKRAKDSLYLQSLATEYSQTLLNQLFLLPSEATKEVGRLILLPEQRTQLPREKPIPRPKPLTRWEIFAKTKGIQKRKRTGKEYDEESGTWKNRWGRDKANDKSNQWLFEHKETPRGKSYRGEFDPEDERIDPWTRMEQEKKANVAKNKKQQERNIRMATLLKGRKNSASTIDLASVVGADHRGKRNAQHKEKKQKDHVDIALSVAQRSTNSMGKFDQKRKGEPTIKRKVHTDFNKLNKYENELGQSQSVMRKVIGRMKESEALNVQKAIHSIAGANFEKGEMTTLQGVKARSKLQSKMQRAKSTQKNKRKNDRIDKAKGIKKPKASRGKK